MHIRSALIPGITVVLGLGACSSGSTHPPSSATQPTATSATATTQPAAPSAAPSATTGAAQNLPVTAAIRQSLVAAGATAHHLTPADYVGLRTGETYYGYDPATSTYWAGAALDPSPTSTPAQVASQDDGSYLLFSMPTGGSWTVYDDGLSGIGGTPCPVAVPASLVAAWGWAPGACAPASR